MIAKIHRFHGHGSLKFVYQKGRTVRGPHTTLRFVINSRRKTYRLAVVVSKKVSKSAVTRNRIRRRLYQAFRRVEGLQEQPYDLVVTVFNEQLATVPAEEITQIVTESLDRAHIVPAQAQELSQNNDT